MADYAWPDPNRRALLGKRISRLDGPAKSSGRATYTFDVRRPGMLFGKPVLSPHAHARIVSIDTRAAEAMPGVKAVDIIMDAGREIMWAGQEIAAVAAETEPQARDAARQSRSPTMYCPTGCVTRCRAKRLLIASSSWPSRRRAISRWASPMVWSPSKGPTASP